ncbi:MAG: GtrA family protein, partial [Candidatus Thiodiazotropha sp.]
KETKASCKILQSREDFLCRVADVFYCRVNNIFAFLIAFGVSYIGHSLWTFSHKKHQHNKTVARFLGVAVFSFALNEGGYYLLLEYTQMEYLFSLLIVLIIVPVITFILSKYWAFS